MWYPYCDSYFNLCYVRTSCSPCGLSRIILCVSIYLSVLHCKVSSFFVEVNKCSKYDITFGDEKNNSLRDRWLHMGSFRNESDSIKSYLERVTLYFTANGIEDDRKVPILLSSIGLSTYTTLSDLLAPETPGTKTYEDISTKLKDHFLPKGQP